MISETYKRPYIAISQQEGSVFALSSKETYEPPPSNRPALEPFSDVERFTIIYLASFIKPLPPSNRVKKLKEKTLSKYSHKATQQIYYQYFKKVKKASSFQCYKNR